MTGLLMRDEREAAIDQAADRLSYLVLAFGVLLIAAWRGFNGEPSWELLGLVVLAGAAGLGYRLLKGVVTRSWIAIAAVSLLGAALVAVIVTAGGLIR
jgi:hypothetical protein